MYANMVYTNTPDPDLLRRIHMLKYLARVTIKSKIKSLVPGMFTSKLMYALHLTSSLWGLNEYTAKDLKKVSCPKQTMHKIKSCQRQAVALLAPDLVLTPDLTPQFQLVYQ